MPVLPSGRRIEFSLDRFHALLERMDPPLARLIVNNLNVPDDLLSVADAVHFSLQEGAAYFAGYVAADWAAYAADWSEADRQALQAWFDSAAARRARAEAIDYIRALHGADAGPTPDYPYLMANAQHQTGFAPAPRLRQ